MEGEWHVYRRGDRWRAPAFTARAVIGATGRTAPSGRRSASTSPTSRSCRPPTRTTWSATSVPIRSPTTGTRSRRRGDSPPTPGRARRAPGPAQHRRVRQRVRQRDPVRARHPSHDTRERDGCRSHRRPRRPHDPRQPQPVGPHVHRRRAARAIDLGVPAAKAGRADGAARSSAAAASAPTRRASGSSSGARRASAEPGLQHAFITMRDGRTVAPGRGIRRGAARAPLKHRGFLAVTQVRTNCRAAPRAAPRIVRFGPGRIAGRRGAILNT